MSGLESQVHQGLRRVEARYSEGKSVRELMESVVTALIEEGVADGVVVDMVVGEEEAQSAWGHRDKADEQSLKAVVERREDATLGRPPEASVSMGDIWLWSDGLVESTRPMVWSDDKGRDFIQDLRDEADAQALAVWPLEGAGRAVGSVTLIRGADADEGYGEQLRSVFGEAARRLGFLFDAALWREKADRCEQLARRRKTIYDRIFGGRGVGVFVLDDEGRVIDSNDEALALLRFDEGSQVMGELVGRLLNGGVRGGEARSALNRAIHTGEDLEVMRTIIHRGDGTRFPVVVSLVGLRGEDEFGRAVMLFRSLMHYKGMQAELLAADRVIALGTMASGLAHEINNPLAFARANISYVCQSMEDEGDEKEALLDALEGMERIGQIVSGMKVFSEKSYGAAEEPVDLQEVIDDTLRLSKGILGDAIDVERQGMGQLGEVRATKSRLVQVVMNLVLNAAKAIALVEGREGGTIRLEGEQDGDEYILRVSDDGVGIEPQLLDAIFDPFVTTHEGSGGTHGSGLGLYICRTIVVEVGGQIDVTSTPGEGTTFRVRLPVA